MRGTTRSIAFLVPGILFASGPSFAIDVSTGTEDLTLAVDTNLQFRNENTYGGAPPTTTAGASPTGHVNTDFFLRRASLTARGEALKLFTFYLKLETGRFGARGDYSTPSLLQDVVVGYVPVRDFTIEGGFLKTPLSRPALDSSPRASSLEGVSDILMYPNSRAQRQNGLQIRTLIFDRRLLIRGGAYEGARNGESGGRPVTATNPPINPQGVPMFAGMVRVNLLGYETSYTYPAIYVDGSSHVSVGVGGQYQAHSGSPRDAASVYDYSALAADVFVDVPVVGPNTEAMFILDVYHFDYGPGKPKTGNGAHGEIGLRWGPIQPQGNFYWFNSETKVNSFLRLAGGLNYYLRGHRAKLQAEFSSTIANGVLPDTPGLAMSPRLKQFNLQAQLAF